MAYAPRVSDRVESDWKTGAHVASFVMWASSIEQAIKKGGWYWVPVVLGLMGHVATALAKD
jgi:hypothetical protein